MKRILILFCMFALSLQSAHGQSKNVAVKTDRFTGKTTVMMKEFSVGPFLGFPDVTQPSSTGVMFSLGAIAENSNDVSLVVFITAGHWQFLQGADVHVLVDGQKMDLGHFVATQGHVEALGAVTTNETVIAKVDRAAFEKMASAKVLEMEVGSYPMKLNAKNIQRFKEFADALRVSAPSTAKLE